MTVFVRNENAPRWLRVACGIFAGAGVTAIAIITYGAIRSSTSTLDQVIIIPFALYGIYLFAHIAARGSLPNYLLRKANGRPSK